MGWRGGDGEVGIVGGGGVVRKELVGLEGWGWGGKDRVGGVAIRGGYGGWEWWVGMDS